MYKQGRRFAKKKPDAAPLEPYAVFNPHKGLPTLWDGTTLRVASIDPGIDKPGMEISDHFQGGTKTLFLEQLCFRENKEDNYYMYASEVLDHYLPYFLTCQFIVIESQESVNTPLIRMSQHIMSHLCSRLQGKGNRPIIVEIDNHCKTRLLGAPPMKKKLDRKKWCRDKAIQILRLQGQAELADKTEKAPLCRTYDPCDSLCQRVGFMILYQQYHTNFKLEVEKK